eukprot:tig00000489_g1383.t1
MLRPSHGDGDLADDPHSVPSPRPWLRSRRPRRLRLSYWPVRRPASPGHDCDGGPAAEPGPTPDAADPSLHPDYTAPTDASMPDSTTADSSGTERTEDVPMGDPRVSRGIIVDTPTLPSLTTTVTVLLTPTKTRPATRSRDQGRGRDLGHRHAWTILRLKPVVHNQLRAYLDTPRRFMVTTTTTDWRKTPETPTSSPPASSRAACTSQLPAATRLLGNRCWVLARVTRLTTSFNI